MIEYKADVREQVAQMRELAGIGRAEVSRRTGIPKTVLRAFDARRGPLKKREQGYLLRILRVLCDAEGCDYPNRLRRVRNAAGWSMKVASAKAGFPSNSCWRRLESEHKAPVMYQHVRVQTQAVLVRLEKEFGLVDAAE